jgi:hypothetical protein
MKPARQSIPKARGCRGCPCRAPSGRCLDPTIKSGRCGDWVWYVRGNQRFRHLYVKPQDPRTPKQLHWRDRFGAASKHYSDSLTQEQRDACIAAGAKFRSRPRLAQSGPLTGQQYSIRMECTANAGERAPSAGKAQKGLQTQGILLSTSGTHRGISGVPPDHGRRDTGRVGRKAGRRKNGECRRQKVRAASEVRQAQRVTRSRWVHYRNTTRINGSDHRLARPQVNKRRPTVAPLPAPARNHLPPATDPAHVTRLAAGGIRDRKAQQQASRRDRTRFRRPGKGGLMDSWIDGLLAQPSGARRSR